ncbi:MAG: DUF89 family protein [Methanobrevibacter sp.]|nr:DUF89 family protein [Methanobrevibacter sp.]
MKPYYECGACFLRQARELLDLSTDDEDLKFRLMENTFDYLAKNFSKEYSPNELASVFNQNIKRKTGCSDPYVQQKKLGTDVAMSMISQIKEILHEDNSLENHVKMAIVGNILDFGAFDINTDVQSLIKQHLNKSLAINDFDALKSALKKHDEALYLLDNTGEIIFDKLLADKISQFDVDVCVAVKESPIVNDACFSDASDVGFVNIVSIGIDSAGIVDSMISDEFREVFKNSSLIISKGMANYEGITEMNLDNKDVFCLLCAKCNPIAKDLNVDITSHVLNLSSFVEVGDS